MDYSTKKDHTRMNTFQTATCTDTPVYRCSIQMHAQRDTETQDGEIKEVYTDTKIYKIAAATKFRIEAELFWIMHNKVGTVVLDKFNFQNVGQK